MKLKKNPKASLERFSNVFSLLGLVLTLFVCYVFIEHKTYASTPKTLVQTNIMDNDNQETLFVLNQIKKQPKIIQKNQVHQKKKSIKKTDNSFVKTENNIKVIDVPFNDSIDEEITEDDLFEDPFIDEYEDKTIETIPFVSVESVPLFPGCEKYKENRAKAQQCFNKKVTKFFNKKFDIGIANNTELVGLQKITCNFIIDDEGKVEAEIKTSNTHPLIENEIKNTLKKLPKMTPASQNGKNVKILYRLPVKFIIE